MPTAVDTIVVEVEEAATPPNTAKMTKKKENDGRRKITPSSEAPKAEKTPKTHPKSSKAAQPSIMSFFKQTTGGEGKKLFAKPTPSKSCSASSSTKKRAPSSVSTKVTPTNDNSRIKASKPADATEKSAKEELMETVLGTGSSQGLVIDTAKIEVPPEALDSVLPVLPKSALKKRTTAKNDIFKPTSVRDTAATPSPTYTQAQVDAGKETAVITLCLQESSSIQSETEQVDDDDETIGMSMSTVNGGKAADVANETDQTFEVTLCPLEKSPVQSETEKIDDDDDDTVDMNMSTVNDDNTADAMKQTDQGFKDLNDADSNLADAPAGLKQNAALSPTPKVGTTKESTMDCVDLMNDDNAPSKEPNTTKKMATDEAKEKPPQIKRQIKTPPSVLESSIVISAERNSLLTKYEALRAQYAPRLDELVAKARDGLEEERFDLPSPNATSGNIRDTSTDFPDAAILTLALIIQESHLTLNDLVATAIIQLREAFPSLEFNDDSVSSKSKVLATREQYVHTLDSGVLNVFEDENQDLMWRWEIIALELLPDEFTAKVKRARAARKKLRTHSKALCNLLKLFDQAKSLLEDSNCTQAKCDAISTKISTAEEKVLKFEREAEKARIAEETKEKKEVEKFLVQEQKKKEKAAAQEQKKKEQAEAKEQKMKEQAEAKEQKMKEQAELKERKKQEREQAAKKKEELKRKRTEEKLKELEKKELKLKKQRTMMASFFSQQSPNAEESTPKADTSTAPSAPDVDQDKLWSLVNASETHAAGPLFPKLSPRAVSSRARRTRRVSVETFTMTVSDDANPFASQPYAEQITIRVPNKYKYLSFHEDCRPPYHGTWSKKSSLVTGRKPFGKDTSHLDYDVDSEAEWEEGDDELGEDCEDEGPDDEDEVMDDEEGDTRVYNYQDGFLAEDDDLGSDDEVDEETKLLRKKKLQVSNTSNKIADHATVCVIAPGRGGVPFDNSLDLPADGGEMIEGASWKEALGLFSSHTGIVLISECPCLDAFPPALVEEGNLDVPAGTNGKASQNDEMSKDDVITFVKFVHHCPLNSKEKLVEELRIAHNTITSSRAQATRKLDSIAEKKRNPSGGFYWEVHRNVLEDLGLDDLLNMQIEVSPPANPPSATKAAKTPSSTTKGQVPKADELPREDFITFVKFVHHCTFPSKDKVVEELRTTHTTVTSSRAQAARKLDAIAEKKRNPNGGVYWEVHRQVLEELGLHELMSKEIKVSAPSGETKATNPPASAKRGSTPASSKHGDLKGKCGKKGLANKKRPLPNDLSGSVKLLSVFFKRAKKTETKEE